MSTIGREEGQEEHRCQVVEGETIQDRDPFGRSESGTAAGMSVEPEPELAEVEWAAEERRIPAI